MMTSCGIHLKDEKKMYGSHLTDQQTAGKY